MNTNRIVKPGCDCVDPRPQMRRWAKFVERFVGTVECPPAFDVGASSFGKSSEIEIAFHQCFDFPAAIIRPEIVKSAVALVVVSDLDPLGPIEFRKCQNRPEFRWPFQKLLKIAAQIPVLDPNQPDGLTDIACKRDAAVHGVQAVANTAFRFNGQHQVNSQVENTPAKNNQFFDSR
ncbi:hypothetical protein [Hoeflea poritis]|uniref:Uncharacterized protein n=1 Tax=Hoeflea poritis TaxID=2993659 RepID=A0ABT4VJ54_9HYPH|nr:hypothetical protein [Hoeflea poritis]MDA4844058.1 hypothetical protein [Hoeflea poritis]